MEDTRLKVFYAVARNLSFTRASRELCLSQPAITKHIAYLEDHYQVKLFERSGNKIALTPPGRIFLAHAKRILAQYNELTYDISLLNRDAVGRLRLGASTTIAQYILPRVLAEFTGIYPKIELSLLNDNSEKIEKALLDGEIDLGFVENVSRARDLGYTAFLSDRLVPVVSAGARLKSLTLSLTEFRSVPLILRERGSGTLDTIVKILEARGLKLDHLNIRMFLGSTEAIKRFLLSSDCLGIVSVFAVERELAEKSLKVVEIEGLEFARELCVVRARGEHSDLSGRFIRFVESSLGHNLKL